jgi:hypothetical protein
MSKVNDWVLRARVAHHAGLVRLAGSLGVDNSDGLTLWRRLHRIEAEIHRKATDYYNGDLDTDGWELARNRAQARVAKVLGGLPVGFFINGDPRGYALKIEGGVDFGLHRDCGRYQILAPDINQD